MALTGTEVTHLLRAWNKGDSGALNQLIPILYDELHRIAGGYMSRERSGHVLQTTALVNEVYVRLVDARQCSWQNRAHFLAVCAQIMRRILVDFARERGSAKRGGDAVHISLDPRTCGMLSVRTRDVLAVDEALRSLEKLDQRKSKVVEMKFFAGLSMPEIAEVLQVSPETVQRDWKFSKAWLSRELIRVESNGIRTLDHS